MKEQALNAKVIGIIVLLVVIGGGLGYYFFSKAGPGLAGEAITLKGYAGGEKMGFLRNEKVQQILARKYGIELDYAKAGSVEMVRQDMGADVDFLWPSNQVALEFYRMRTGQKPKSEIIFNSPIVIYSWGEVTDALIKQGLVKKEGAAYFITNFKGLIDLVIQQKRWKEIGLPELYGKVSIVSTDPTRSNSGNIFSGLLANILHGDVVDQAALPGVQPQVVAYFRRLGYLQHSSGDLFEQYLSQGMGAHPLVVGYENQIVEYSLEHQDRWPEVRDRVRILYPVPTVWSSHPLIIVKPRARVLIEALRDEEIQRIAWEEHGFRSGMLGVENDPEVLKIVGIPARIKQVIPMPTARVMDSMIKALQ